VDGLARCPSIMVLAPGFFERELRYDLKNDEFGEFNAESCSGETLNRGVSIVVMRDVTTRSGKVLLQDTCYTVFDTLFSRSRCKRMIFNDNLA
jgi:hypothetical protein